MNCIMTRDVVFKMERPGLVKEGQVVEVTESVTPFNVNYMIEPAVAMSGLFKLNDRLKSDHGVVKKIEENARGYSVTVTFENESRRNKMGKIPKDPVMCMSVVNTLLRDQYETLDALCEDLEEEKSTLTERLSLAGFVYDAEKNQFR